MAHVATRRLIVMAAETALKAASAAAANITTVYARTSTAPSAPPAPEPPKARPKAATARRPPARAAALLIPDAVPLISVGAESNTVIVSGAMLIVMPIPTTINPGRTLLQ